MKKRPLKNSGLTLIEMLMAIFVSSLLIMGSISLFKVVFTGSKQQTAMLGSADQARKVSFNFVNEMRNATTGNDGSYPINLANNTSLTFYSNYGASTGQINRYRYYTSNQKLYKGTIVPTGNPLTYNSANETTKLIHSGLASTSATIFKYYDGNFAGTSSPLTQPVNVNQIKFVKIDLLLLTQNTKASTTTYTVSAGTAIRSLKTNLGS